MPYLFKKYYSPRKLFFFFGEGALIFFSLIASYYFFSDKELFLEILHIYILRALLVTIIFQTSLYFLDLYDLSELLTTPETILRILQSFGIGCIVLALLYYLFPLIITPKEIFVPGFFVVCLSVFIWRFLYNHIIRRKMFSKSVIVVGTGKIAHDISLEIKKQPDTAFEIIHFIGTPDASFPLPAGIPVSEDAEELPTLCKKFNIEQVVVAIDNPRGHTPIKQLMDCKFLGFPVEYGIKFYEKLTGKILVENVKPAEIIFSEGFKKNRLQTFSKQTIDFILACVGLVITLPITLLTAILIRLESPGPIFYKQERVGLYGNSFNVIKFRSMKVDAEKDGPVWAKKDDDRVTRCGKFIRKTRIDELPQMINVLRGEMSFVGPRPERPVFVDRLAQILPYYSIRHNVMPGITGWAQICYPYGDSEEDALRKLEYDLYYLKYMSIQLDISIIFQTLKTVIFRKGSR